MEVFLWLGTCSRPVHLPVHLAVRPSVRAREAGPRVLRARRPRRNRHQALQGNARQRRDLWAPGVLLEVSGGVTLATVGALARTGVDRISVGALTHSAPALDIGLDFGD